MICNIKSHIKQAYPELCNRIQLVSSLEALQPNTLPVDQAVLKTVIGQMLSRKAADTIYRRVELVVAEDVVLTSEILTRCGLSGRKAKTVIGFMEAYEENPKKYENWRNLEYRVLEKEVSEFWGLSSWTASMLAIFHFAHSDVFPATDGTLNRALSQLSEEGIHLDVNKAEPYRTYLALYLWKFIDEGVL